MLRFWLCEETVIEFDSTLSFDCLLQLVSLPEASVPYILNIDLQHCAASGYILLDDFIKSLLEYRVNLEYFRVPVSQPVFSLLCLLKPAFKLAFE